MISIIAAKTKNNVIGVNNTLPWKQRNDMQRFKSLTYGAEVLMGRKTWDSIGQKPLPGRYNSVVSRDELFHGRFWQNVAVSDTDYVASDAKYHLQTCEVRDSDLFVIGGAQIYEVAMEYAARLYITELDVELEGDAFFPTIDMSIWKKIAEEKYQADVDNEYGYNFITYVRK